MATNTKLTEFTYVDKNGNSYTLSARGGQAIQ